MDPPRHAGIAPSAHQLWANSAEVYLTYPLRATHFIDNQSHISDDSGSPRSLRCLLVRTLLTSSDRLIRTRNLRKYPV